MSMEEDVNSFYSNLHDDIDKYEDEYLRGDEGDSSALIPSTLDEADRLLERVRKMQEVKVDASLMYKLSDMAYRRVKLSSEVPDFGGVSVDNFVGKIRSFLTQGEQDGTITQDEFAAKQLDKLGQMSYSYLNVVPSVDFMVGPISVEKKTQARRSGHRLQINEKDDTRPENLRAEDMKQTEERTSKLITEIFKDIRSLYRRNGGAPILLYELIINPHSFSQSVENLFYTSFLVRDGRLSLGLNENGLPVLMPVDNYGQEQSNGSNAPAGDLGRQVIIDLDMPTWRELVQVLEISEPVIKTRPSTV